MYIYVYVNHFAVYLKRTQYCKSNFNIKKIIYMCVHTYSVSWGCCNKIPQAGWLRTHIFSLVGCEVQSHCGFDFH